MIKLISLDLDGTLLTPEGTITAASREAIARARAAGLRELHISVERDNIHSVRVIKGRGGVYERSFTHDGAGADVYLIAL